MNRVSNNQSGVSVVEVLIALSMAGIIVASIGNALAATHRLTQSSELKQRATAYAKQITESITENQRELFACVCNGSSGYPHSAGTCASGTCTRTSDSQQCAPAPLYQSCWTTYPNGLSGNAGPYHYDFASNMIVASAAALDAQFTQTISITNISNDPNRKQISVVVSWTEREVPKNITNTTILTGWKNETP